jgi:RNA polymerase sigma-70 factor (ECF subfamily)
MSACASACVDRPAVADRPATSDRSATSDAPATSDRPAAVQERSHLLDPDSLGRHIDQLFRAAWALCGNRDEAEDLVQETFLNVLKRPRFLRNRDEIGYLLRALRNTYASRYRKTAGRPRDRQLLETDLLLSDERGAVNAREIMEAIAGAPPQYRDAVIAVDLIGLSYREAARSLRTREATLTTRLHRGRQYVARALVSESVVGA